MWLKYMLGPGGLEPDEYMTGVAAEFGQLEMLRYLCEETECDPEDCREVAEENGHTAMVEWIDSVREV